MASSVDFGKTSLGNLLDDLKLITVAQQQAPPTHHAGKLTFDLHNRGRGIDERIEHQVDVLRKERVNLDGSGVQRSRGAADHVTCSGGGFTSAVAAALEGARLFSDDSESTWVAEVATRVGVVARRLSRRRRRRRRMGGRLGRVAVGGGGWGDDGRLGRWLLMHYSVLFLLLLMLCVGLRHH